jgi:hypothetical protein
LTAVGADGREVVVPMTTPASIVATGHDGEAMATLLNHEKVATVTASVCRECIVVDVGSGWAWKPSNERQRHTLYTVDLLDGREYRHMCTFN